MRDALIIYSYNQTETPSLTTDLFFNCVYSEAFWEDLQDWLSTSIQLLSQEKTLFWGVILGDKDKESDLIVNIVMHLSIFYPCKQVEENQATFLF